MSEPKLMAKISRIMWDTYAKTDQDLDIGKFSRPKPKAELICGVPYTGTDRLKDFLYKLDMKEYLVIVLRYAPGGNHHSIFHYRTLSFYMF